MYYDSSWQVFTFYFPPCVVSHRGMRLSSPSSAVNIMVPIRADTSVGGGGGGGIKASKIPGNSVLTLSSFTESKRRDLQHHWQLEICSGTKWSLIRTVTIYSLEQSEHQTDFAACECIANHVRLLKTACTIRRKKKDEWLFKCNQARNVRTDPSNIDISWLVRSFTFKHSFIHSAHSFFIAA